MKKVIIQIAFQESLLRTRAAMLKLRGYSVLSALRAEGLAALPESVYHRAGLFLLGHAATLEERAKLVQQIRQKNPALKILALKSTVHASNVPGADATCDLEDAETWLSKVDEMMGPAPGE